MDNMYKAVSTSLFRDIKREIKIKRQSMDRAISSPNNDLFIKANDTWKDTYNWLRFSFWTI